MSVGTWNPSEQIAELDETVLGQLLAAAERPPDEDFGLLGADVERLAGVAHTNRVDWAPAVERLGNDDLIALVRLYTLAEAIFPSWKANANSPVIVIAKSLRKRNAWPADLTHWIKRHSENKFLPYGSLLQRL